MLTLDFGGWFQCRLATDPDPYDEPRGVSGYVRAYAGEPNLDRVVHWQPPPFSRALAPQVGVTVLNVAVDGTAVEGSALNGAKVRLHNSPVFEGRNGVVAEDGFEPVSPIDLEIAGAQATLRRRFVPYDELYPFEGMLAGGVDVAGAAEIQRFTGIANLTEVWRARLEQLRAASPTTEPHLTATRERIAFLEDNLSRARSAARFFGARMHFNVTLNSTDPTVAGVSTHLGIEPDVHESWLLRFWLGGWDADVLCGYCVGRLSVPRRAESVLNARESLPRGIHRDRV